MNNLTTFNFNSSELRVVELEGEPWFVAADVCKSLELKGAPSKHLLPLDVKEKQIVIRDSNKLSVELRKGLFLNTRLYRTSLISESGLYKLIMRSDKPQAKPFQDWVTKVVLPAIRKDGGYIGGEENVTDEDELVLKAITILQRKVTRLAEEKLIAEGERDVAVKTIAKVSRTLREVCRKLPHVNLQKTKEDLLKLGYLYRPAGGCYLVRRSYSHLFSERFVESKGWNVISPTEEGISLLVSLYVQGELTLKKGYTPEASISV